MARSAPRSACHGGQIEIGADLGSRRGDNLFHSFEKFGIATGQTATFTGPGDIRNVISRVTGGEVSNIDGTLASKVGQADLYFLNPAGVMFGPNAGSTCRARCTSAPRMNCALPTARASPPWTRPAAA